MVPPPACVDSQSFSPAALPEAVRCRAHLAMDRCEDEDFIHSWLAGINTSAIPDQYEQKGHDDTQFRRRNEPTRADWQNMTGAARNALSNRDRLGQPRGPPILAQPPPSHTSSPRSRNNRTRCGRGAVEARSSRTPDSDSSVRNDYRRRLRRKTRRDRYDVRRETKIPNRDYRRDYRKAHQSRKKKLRSGREVMGHFASVAISSDRLTVRHQCQASAAFIVLC